MSGTIPPHALRFHIAVALGVAVVCTVVLTRPRRPSSGELGRRADDVLRWCADNLEPISGGGCLATPSGPSGAARSASGAGSTPLLIYLHGRYSPQTVGDELERQARVARMGTARGYAVLALRGVQGQCTDPTYAEWWCWPSNERNADRGPEFVVRWKEALAVVEQRIGQGRRVLLGFSNGGYFAALIASRNLAPFDAVTIAHAGPVSPMRPYGRRPPVLLITAEQDASDAEMWRLDADLSREDWPHVMVDREGGHALPDWDVEMALSFFDRTRSERLPLVPPLSSRPLRPRPVLEADAGSAELVAPTPPAASSGTNAGDAATPSLPGAEDPSTRSPPGADVLSTPPSWDARSTDPSPE